MSREDVREGICQNCWLEFYIDDEGVQIVKHPKSGRCLIIVDGQAHSLLMGKDFKRVLRQIYDENHRRQINRYLDDETPAEELQAISIEDFHDASNLTSTEEAR